MLIMLIRSSKLFNRIFDPFSRLSYKTHERPSTGLAIGKVRANKPRKALQVTVNDESGSWTLLNYPWLAQDGLRGSLKRGEFQTQEPAGSESSAQEEQRKGTGSLTQSSSPAWRPGADSSSVPCIHQHEAASLPQCRCVWGGACTCNWDTSPDAGGWALLALHNKAASPDWTWISIGIL